MELEKLITNADCTVKMRAGDSNPDIGGIACDSRTVKQGDLFIAIPGTRENGDSFIAEALARGAAAVVSETGPTGLMIPWVQVDNARRSLGLIGRAFWGIDVAGMLLTGITGTNGKTTIAHLFKKLFEQRFGAEGAWMFGTIDYQLGSKRLSARHTTPEAIDIFRHIGESKNRPGAVIMEVSSHALALDRVAGLSFDLALLTNVTQDHLDFHKTMENYYQAKKRLFTDFLKQDGCCAVNIDDPWGRRLVQEINKRKCITFGTAADAVVRIGKSECTWDGTRIEIVARGKRMQFASALRGAFNVYNMAALCAGALGLSFDEAVIAAAFAAVKTVPGRMDRVPLDLPFAVVVDYAHTPDALINILKTSRPLTSGKLICVFGCGGDRDRTKRPIMGAAVAANADEAVVTSDNPRSERPVAIIEEILAGMPLDFPHLVIPDRRDAIKKAIELAQPGDCVVVAGKGHETYQEIAGIRHPFNDRDVVVEICNGIGKTAHA